MGHMCLLRLGLISNRGRYFPSQQFKSLAIGHVFEKITATLMFVVQHLSMGIRFNQCKLAFFVKLRVNYHSFLIK